MRALFGQFAYVPRLMFNEARRAGQLAVVITCVLAFAPTAADAAAADDPLLGERVVLAPGAKAYIDDDAMDVRNIRWPAKVAHVEGDWLGVERAWVRRSDVLTIDQAHRYYSEQIHSEPTAAAYRNRSLCWPLGEPDKGLDDLEAALRLDPQDALALCLRADARMKIILGNKLRPREEIARMLDLQPLIDDLTTAIRADGTLSFAYELRGILWMFASQPANCRRDLTEALRLNPGKVSLLSNRATASVALGLFPAALADCEAALELDPDHLPALNSRANLRLMLHEVVGAIEDFEAAMQLAPDKAEFKTSLGWILAACPDDGLRNGARAKELALQLCQAEGGRTASNVDLLGAACAELGEYDLALQYAQEALELATKQADEGLMGRVQKRIAQFEQRKPWRDERLRPVAKKLPKTRTAWIQFRDTAFSWFG